MSGLIDSALARGDYVVEDRRGFAVELTGPAVETCFFLPEERHSAGACEGFDPTAIRGSMAGMAGGRHVLGGAALRHDGNETIALVMDTTQELGPATASDLPTIIRSLSKGIQAAVPASSSEPAPASEFFEVGKLQVIHTRTALHPSKEMPELLLYLDFYFVLTEGSAKVLAFVTFASDMPAMSPVITRVVKSVLGRPPHKRPTGLSAEEIGFYFGPPVIALALLLFVGVAIAVVRRRLGRRRQQRDEPL